MVNVSSWGRLGSWPHAIKFLSDRHHLLEQMQSSTVGIAHGMGRSYGDVCLNPGGVLWQTRGLDRFISFDEARGYLICEAGVLLRDIQKLIVPCGWMLPVTPGTQFVTVGGALANDVHGKNHHGWGSFGDHVRQLKLIRTEGSIIECGPAIHADWFTATVGGLGLTGLISEVHLQLRRIPGPWLKTETIPYTGLDAFFRLSEDSDATWEHTVSWIDCTSARGIFMRAHPIDVASGPQPKEGNWRFPLVPPVSLVNKMTLRPFNNLYFNLNKRQLKQRLMHYETFLYPLDRLHDWNRLYGPKGFFQYQSLVPYAVATDALQAMLGEIKACSEGSFLSVLKCFGNRKALGLLSFPQAGVTLALDFPNRGERSLALFTRLDAIVREAGGRLYPAKDIRMPRDLFEAGYPRLNEFLAYRDPGISSAFSRRLMGDLCQSKNAS